MQNQVVASDGKAPDRTDGMERYTIPHPDFSISPLLKSKTIGELHCENCVSLLIKKLSQLGTPDRNNVLKNMKMLEQLFSSLILV